MKLKFLITVPNKHNRNEVYEAGTIYEFEDKRAKEILSARTPVTKEPYAEEYVEPVAIVENVKNEGEIPMENVKEVTDTNVGDTKPKKKKKTK